MTHAIGYCAQCDEPYCRNCRAGAYCSAVCEQAAASERQRAALADAVVAHAIAVTDVPRVAQVRRRA